MSLLYILNLLKDKLDSFGLDKVFVLSVSVLFTLVTVWGWLV